MSIDHSWSNWLFLLHVKTIFLWLFLLLSRIVCLIFCFNSILFIQQILDEIVYSQRQHMIWRVVSKIIVSVYLCKYLSKGPYMSVAFKSLQSCFGNLKISTQCKPNIPHYSKFTILLKFVFLFLKGKRYLFFFSWDLGTFKSTLLFFSGK